MATRPPRVRAKFRTAAAKVRNQSRAPSRAAAARPRRAPAVTGGAGPVAHVIIGLKTTKGTKQLKLDPSIYESIQKEKVSVGDVIYIEANSGAVKRVRAIPPSSRLRPHAANFFP
jgi:hypothetical protein